MTPELYEKAKLLKESNGALSAVLLQFKLHIGYKLAKELMEAVSTTK